MAETKARLVLLPEGFEISEKQLVRCLVEASCIGTVKMSYDSGPYDITRPSINASRLASAIARTMIAAAPSLPEPDTAGSRGAFSDAELTRIYKEANGEAEGKSRPLTTESIFRAMRAVAQAAEARKTGS